MSPVRRIYLITTVATVAYLASWWLFGEWVSRAVWLVGLLALIAVRPPWRRRTKSPDRSPPP